MRKIRYASKLVSAEKKLPSLYAMPEEEIAYESAHFVLANLINDEFLPEEKVTIDDVYLEITSKYGLTRKDTWNLVRNAVKDGYLSRTKVRM